MYFSGLKPNFRKPEIEAIVVLKGAQVAVCDIHCITLNNNTLKILATHFSYNKKLKKKKYFFKTITDIQRVLKIWKMRNLAIEGVIVIFKTILISKIVLQSFIITVPNSIMNELEKGFS